MLIALLLPGAAEALARCSNDPAVFLWSALVVLAVRENVPTGLILALLALGPLLKLTAFPVVVMSLVWLWKQRGPRLAFTAMFASLLVVPVQLIRGWHGIGTYDVNATLIHLDGSAVAMWQGLLRSLYTVAKTVFWVGGWSFFRAPRSLVLGWFLLLFIALLSLRARSDRRRFVPHALGVLAVVAGVLVVAIANRRIFADWGGVGGWYFWSWFPWLAVAAVDALQISRRNGRKLLVVEATFVVVANVSYFVAASKIYG